MAAETPLLHLEDQHITSLTIDEMDTDDTFRHHLCMVEKPLDHRILQFLYEAGFYHATFLRGYKLVPGLITALIERWRPETHTFHMPCGECTITLEDVVYLIGVPVNGKPLVERTKGSTVEICERYLGKVPYGNNVKGSRVKLSWLETEFELNPYSSVDEIYQVSRAYILQMIGGILMPDKSGNLVNVRYLQFLETPWETGCKYSWGSAILACLYRELCKAAILEKGKKVSGIGGCLLLLQAWAWQRLPFFTPITRTHIQFPLVARWCEEKHETGLVHNNVRVCRSNIDSYSQEQFIWIAYKDDNICLPAYLAIDSMLWCTVTPLIHFHTVEFHFADRVLRQFGFHQPIPRVPRDHYFLHGFDGRGRTGNDWEVIHADYIALWNDRVSWLPYRSPIQVDDFDFDRSEYMIYYRTHGKPYLTTEEEREECQRFKRKYHGKGKSSKVASGSVDSTNFCSRNPEGWPTEWPQNTDSPPPPPTVIWEKEHAPTLAQPAMGSSSSYNAGFDDVGLYRPEFCQPQSPIYSNMNFQEMQNFLNSEDIMGVQSGYVDFFTTPPSMPSVTEDVSYDDDDAEEDPNAAQRPQRARRAPRSYLSTTPRHGQKLRKK